nr:interaptin-like [Onthophagus taurus]
MGNQPSTQENKRRNNDGIVQMRHQAQLRTSLSSSKRLSKSEQKVRDIEIAVKELKRAIEAYDGIRGTPNYKALHSQLSRKGQEVQELLMKSTKPDKQTKYKGYQKEINNLFKLLEEKVETNERQLDSAAIESHSFISPKPADYSAQNSLVSQKSLGYETNLDEVEQRANVLEEEINRAISLEERNKFKFLEQKLNMLYSDLTKIEDAGSKSINRKESINKSLMRQAKKLQNVKQDKKGSLKKANKVNDKDNDREKDKEIITKIEEELSDVEIRVLTFEELKSDAKYRDLDQILKGYWANLSNLGDSSEENRRRKLKTIDLIKKMLQELAKRAEENSKRINLALDKINDVEDEVISLKKGVETFVGLKNDAEYNNYDQKLRSLWAKLNDVHNSYEAVVNRKEEIIGNIQYLLKTLFDNASSKNKAINESCKSYLLEDLEDFENKWVVLDKSIRSNLKSDEREQICEIIESLDQNLQKTLRHLNQKSQQKVIIKEKEFEGIRKIASSKNLDQEGRNMTPPERLISELTISNVLTSLNMIENDADELKNKILKSNNQNDGDFKKDLDDLYLKIDQLESCSNPTVVDQKNKILQKLSEINSLRFNVGNTNRLKTIVENVQKLKKKVDCFSGTHKNVNYVNIEEGLRDCLKELDEIISDNDKINKTKDQLIGKIMRYLEILDERSLKVSSQEDLTKNFSEIASDIVKNLTKIRNDLEKFEFGNLTETVLIEAEIKRCRDDIKSLNPKSTDQTIIQSQYFDYLQKLILYFESHQKSNTGKILISLENELTTLKDDITKLNPIENDLDFEKTQLELDDLLVRVNSVEILTQNDKEFKNNLQGSIQSLTGLLKTKRRASKRMSQYNEQLNQVKLEEVQEAIGKLSDDVYNFSGDNYRKRYDELDEEMTNIFLKIQNLEVDASMRDYLIRQIQSHKKMLQQKLQDITFVKRGTEV